MPHHLSRRQLVVASSLGLAAALADPVRAAANPSAPRYPGTAGGVGPFDSCRDMIAALEARGRLLRIPEADQDAYEAWNRTAARCPPSCSKSSRLPEVRPA